MKLKLSPVLVIILLVAIIHGTVAAAPVPITTALTYQGYLEQEDLPANGTFYFEFRLFDDEGAGTAYTVYEKKPDVLVEDGLFTVELDFGAEVFDGTEWWLQICVSPAVTKECTPLTPRQKLTAAPYASYSLNITPHDHWGKAWSGDSGRAGLKLTNTADADTQYGLHAVTLSPDGGAAVWGDSNSIGVRGWTRGTNSSNVGVSGLAYSYSGAGIGVHGESRSLLGVGVFGESEGNGVLGTSTSASDQYAGVYGENTSDSGYAPGVIGISEGSANSHGGIFHGAWVGIYGQADGPGDRGVWGRSVSGHAGHFSGDVYVTGDLHVEGTLSKGTGSFKIDHPLDPANKYLYHSFVESPDMKNVYDGQVTLDENGEAWVTLPDYFQALNKDYRYQLTSIGAPGPNLYIAQEIKDNRFRIVGGEPLAKVSWQVTGNRQDAYANANRIQVEKDKPASEAGTYLHPEEHGEPMTKGLSYLQDQVLDLSDEETK